MDKTTLNTYLGTLLDMLEFELDGHPRWSAIRAKVLKLFGTKGLLGQIKDDEKRSLTRHVEVNGNQT